VGDYAELRASLAAAPAACTSLCCFRRMQSTSVGIIFGVFVNSRLHPDFLHEYAITLLRIRKHLLVGQYLDVGFEFFVIVEESQSVVSYNEVVFSTVLLEFFGTVCDDIYIAWSILSYDDRLAVGRLAFLLRIFSI